MQTTEKTPSLIFAVVNEGKAVKLNDKKNTTLGASYARISNGVIIRKTGLYSLVEPLVRALQM